MKRFAFGVVVASCLWNIQMQWKADPILVGQNFHVYYHAALGDWNWIYHQGDYTRSIMKYLPGSQISGFGHDLKLAYLWLPWTWLPESLATVLWMIINHIIYFVLCLKVMGKPYGWLIVLGTWKPASQLLLLGNVAPQLAYLLTTALGRYVAPAIKFHLTGVAILFSAVDSITRRHRPGNSIRQFNLHSTLVAFGWREEKVVDAPICGGLVVSGDIPRNPEVV